MARAKRHYIPGHVWHITHRCHKREFLLKFPRDRRRWIEWLYQAKKRYGVSVLNYKYTLSDPRLNSLCSNPTDYLTGQTPVKSSIRIGGQALPLVGLRGNPDEIHSAPLNKSSKFNSLNISFWAGIHLGKHHFC
jgi:hypothetical protein